MNSAILYALVGVVLFCLGLYTIVIYKNLLKKILALNIMGSGVFLVIIALASRDPIPDPIPHAMVITGIVVAVSATAVAIFLMLKIAEVNHEETS